MGTDRQGRPPQSRRWLVRRGHSLTPEDIGRLLIACPDRPGIVAALSHFLFERGANIIHSDQHSTEHGTGTFFTRVEFQLQGLANNVQSLELGFEPVAARFGMQWRFSQAAQKKRLAVFVSRAEHALLELLWQQRAGDLAADIGLVVSNHTNNQELVERQGIPFFHIPITAANKRESEAAELRLLADFHVHTVVLARYMQVLSPAFLTEYPARIISRRLARGGPVLLHGNKTIVFD